MVLTSRDVEIVPMSIWQAQYISIRSLPNSTIKAITSPRGIAISMLVSGNRRLGGNSVGEDEAQDLIISWLEEV